MDEKDTFNGNIAADRLANAAKEREKAEAILDTFYVKNFVGMGVHGNGPILTGKANCMLREQEESVEKPIQEHIELEQEKTREQVQEKINRYLDGGIQMKYDTNYEIKRTLPKEVEEHLKNISKVFPEYGTLNRDKLLEILRKKKPNLALGWCGFHLVVNQAKTCICDYELKKVYDGLKHFATYKEAYSILAKLVTKRLETVFE